MGAFKAVMSFWKTEFSSGPVLICEITVARNALKRKKQHENSLEQTNGQISMLEQQIYSIESANINQETLVAMKNAGAAMKQIHGKMTMEDVDVTMYALLTLITIPPLLYSEPSLLFFLCVASKARHS